MAGILTLVENSRAPASFLLKGAGARTLLGPEPN